jgi:hypothetical protein
MKDELQKAKRTVRHMEDKAKREARAASNGRGRGGAEMSPRGGGSSKKGGRRGSSGGKSGRRGSDSAEIFDKLTNP